MSSNFKSYSQSQFEVDIRTLAASIGKSKYKYILAITKGGLVPAYYLANLLDIKVVKTICLSSYVEKKRSSLIEHRVEGFEEEIKNPKDWLVVDDIVDSGKTMAFIKNKYKNIDTASLFVRANVSKPKYFANSLDSKIWIRFPWERI